MKRKAEPWDKYIDKEIIERTFTSHGLEFVVTTDKESVDRDSDGRAVFTVKETELLKRACGGGKLPESLSRSLHSIKSILGGEVVECTIDKHKDSR